MLKAGAEAARDIYSRAKAIEDTLAQLATNEASILTSIEILAPWQGLDAPIEEIRTGRHVELVLGDCRCAETRGIPR